MMSVGHMLNLLREWGVDACALPQCMGDVPSPIMLKCAESSARLMSDAQRRRMMQ